MSHEKLIVVNPYNEEHLQLLRNFEYENNIKTELTKDCVRIKNMMTEEKYEESQKFLNEITSILMINQKQKIIDCYCIRAEKDIKTCHISCRPLDNFKHTKNITLVIDYAIEILGMEEVFIETEKNDNNMIGILEQEGLENLGEENGKVLYLKEKEEKELLQGKTK